MTGRTARAGVTLAAIVRALANYEMWQASCARDALTVRLPRTWASAISTAVTGEPHLGAKVLSRLQQARYVEMAEHTGWRLTPAGMAAVEAARKQGATP